MLKLLSPKPDQDFHIITKSPHKQYSNSEIKKKEKEDENKSLNEKGNTIIVFDDFSGSSKSKYIDLLFVKWIVI